MVDVFVVVAVRACSAAWDLASANAPHWVPGDWQMRAGELARTPFRYLILLGASLSTGTSTGLGTGTGSGTGISSGTDIGTGDGSGIGTG